MAACLTAAVCCTFFDYDLTWAEGMLFGAILSATDPVAVVSLMKTLGASERLVTVIEGESLFNDGTAVVLFLALKAGLSTEDSGVTLGFGSLLYFFFRMALCGPLLGLMWGIFTTNALAWILNDAVSEIAVTLLSCYSVFAIAEVVPAPSTGHAPFVSGVLAVVALGVYMSAKGHSRISPEIEHQLHSFWAMLSWIMNAIIFYLSGAIIIEKGIYEFKAIRGRDFGYCIILWFALNVIRAIVVACHYPILKRVSEYGFSRAFAAVLTWGGLRGAVGLSLALITEGDDTIDEQLRDRVLFHTAGVALLSLLINGTTTEVLIKLVGLDAVPRAEADAFLDLVKEIDMHTDKFVENLKLDPYLKSAQFNSMWLYLPVYSRELYIRRAMLIVDESDIPMRLRSRWRRYKKKYARKMLADGKLKSEPNLNDMPKTQDGPERSSSFLFRHARGAGYWDRAVLKWRDRIEKLVVRKPRRMESGLPLSVKLKDCFTLREEQILESQRRLVAIRRSEYHHLFAKGLVSPDAFRALVAAGDLELDESSTSSTWTNVSESFDLPWFVQFFYNLRLTRFLAESFVYSTIGFSFDATTTFLRASKTILKSNDFKNLMHNEVLENEICADIARAESFLANLEMSYPDYLLSFKTKTCARAACFERAKICWRASSRGRTEERENSAIINALRSSLKKVAYHPLRSDRSLRPAFLKCISFLDSIPLDRGLEDFSQKCEETIHRKNEEIIPSIVDTSSVIIVRHGAAKVCKLGTLDTVETFEAGDYMGLIRWAGHPMKRSGRMIAVADCTLLSVRLSVLEDLCNAWPQVALGVARECAVDLFNALGLSRGDFASALNSAMMGIHVSVAVTKTSLLLTQEVGFLVRGKVTSGGKTFSAPALLNRKSVESKKDAVDVKGASEDACLLISNRSDFSQDAGNMMISFDFSAEEKRRVAVPSSSSSSNNHPSTKRPGRKRQASAWSRFQSHKF